MSEAKAEAEVTRRGNVMVYVEWKNIIEMKNMNNLFNIWLNTQSKKKKKKISLTLIIIIWTLCYFNIKTYEVSC